MKLFTLMKDGGPESRVWGYWLIEAKKWLSILFLRFEDGSREAYHSHAFNSISWVLKGELLEQRMEDAGDGVFVIKTTPFKPSLLPILTTRDNFHKVTSVGRTWVISFRGPWVDKWKEYIPDTNETLLLTHGRKVLQRWAGVVA